MKVFDSNKKVIDANDFFSRFRLYDRVNDVFIMNQTTIYIPGDIGIVFRNLKQLEIMSSRLKFIQRGKFKGMTSLLDLRLDHNEIETISLDTFWDLKTLQWLSLNGNKLKCLNEGLTLRMSTLLWITSDDNDIESFRGDVFQRNIKLELISLRRNKIKKIDFSIKKFKRLSFLDLRENLCVNEYFSKMGKVSTANEFQNKTNANCYDDLDELMSQRAMFN